jgi:adenylate kinase family enzyme
VIGLNPPRTILIFGAAGSGSTTVARAIACQYGYHHIEVDEALFEPSDPPFLVRRTDAETLAIVTKQMVAHELCVISGSIIGWGESFKSQIDLIVFLHLPVDIRIDRIRRREEKRFGSRVAIGGDMYLQHLAFLDWVRAYETGAANVRSLNQHRAWLSDFTKPIVTITDPLSVDEILNRIKGYLSAR